ncbi:integrase [Sphaerisporangium siamense]|uniref:Site-specific recombinase XerD n=1 Tax=Sphaerisporangium siamense TaxID=795645 RepID=A0A7W7DG30_9ACTN|nr:tyrosine-type recombinase/integrase [Sphaerisporangium siamense]MBB4706152.1 site-specific recombinase XerD [Sphaerisporangium siamense]GII89713.1 integrase [Sphaerisporangium siamense]
MTELAPLPPGGLAPADDRPADRELSPAARERLAAGLAANTGRAYARDWAAFTAWCAAAGRTPLPATAETLTEYVTHLAATPTARGTLPAPSTIERALACVQSRHKKAGLLLNAEGARLALRAYRKERAAAGTRARKAPPAVLDDLRAMVDACDPTTLAGLRDRAALVLGFALMGRRSELAALDIEDLAPTVEGLEVLIRASKTDQDAIGEVVPLPYGSHPDTCPVRVVQAWTTALAKLGVTAGPLLRGIDRHGRITTATPGASGKAAARISGHGLNLIVRRAAVRAGLPGAETYTAHSLRAGGATAAAKAGAPVSAIARHGRWSEKSPVVHGYIRAADKWRDNPMRGVGL